MQIYDCAVIGGGPAAVSAVINLKLLNKNFIWLTSGASKKVASAELIKNYPGLPSVTGGELAWTFQNHVDGMNIPQTQALATGVYRTDDGFTVLAGKDDYSAKCIILCIGVQSGKSIEGEEEFLGRGVSYCATCDGFLYKDKTIAVLCTDKKYESEIEYLAELSSKCYVFPMYKNCGVKNEKAQIVLKQPAKITGDMRLKKILFKDGEIDADGFFILRNSVAPSTLVHGLETEGGHIKVKRDLSTNIEGIFAAGDCTGAPYQYAKAVGEGNVAAHSAVEYLAKLKK